MTNKNLLHIPRGSTSSKRQFTQRAWPKKTPSFFSTPFVSVRKETEIPSSALDYFKMDPRTHQVFTPAEKLIYAQVFMHEIDEGTRLLALAGKMEEAKALYNFSNKMHPSSRLELLRSLSETPSIESTPAQRIGQQFKARNNQWGAIKTRMGTHQAVAVTELGVGYKERNEDAFLVMPNHKVLALSDGMGGHAGGHIASCIAIDFFEYAVNQGMSIEEGIVFANEAILIRSKSDPKLGGMHPMGCTFAAVQLKNNSLKIAYVGDTKVMVLRKGKIKFETKDHTQGQQLLEEGLVDLATAFELNHILNRCLGFDLMRSSRDVTLANLTLEPSDRVLLATDGITDNFFDGQFCLADLAQMSCEGPLAQAANFVIDTCLSRMLSSALPNGRHSKHDNVSLAMLEFHG